MKQLYKHISTILKSLRRERGWSLDRAAEETGVSKAMLGQIEREESSPTIATLWKIARGFNMPFSSFVANPDSDLAKPVYRTGRTKHIHPQDEKIRVMTLFPFDKELNCEIFIIELLPGCIHLSPGHEKGVIEHVIVAHGQIEVMINGMWQKVARGEGLRFDASESHGYRNLTTTVASFHDVIHYPGSSRSITTPRTGRSTATPGRGRRPAT